MCPAMHRISHRKTQTTVFRQLLQNSQASEKHLCSVSVLVLWDHRVFPQDVDTEVCRWRMHGGLHELVVTDVTPSHSNRR